MKENELVVKHLCKTYTSITYACNFVFLLNNRKYLVINENIIPITQ